MLEKDRVTHSGPRDGGNQGRLHRVGDIGRSLEGCVGVHRQDCERALQAEPRAAPSWPGGWNGSILCKGKAGLRKVEWLAQGEECQTFS